MKVIFLDIDGVLNSFSFMEDAPLERKFSLQDMAWWAEMIDPRAVALLNDLLDRSKASVVVSSTWRLGKTVSQLREILSLKGFRGDIIDKTPRLSGCIRGTEIQKWLDSAHDVESFVILDDDQDMGTLRENLVKTSYKDGLQRHHVDAALKVLSHTGSTGV